MREILQTNNILGDIIMDETLIQGSNEWLKMRRRYIGASDAPILMGVSKFKIIGGRVRTPYLLWQDKIGIAPDVPMTSAMKYGHDMEPIARGEYERMSGFLVSPTIVFHSSVPFMMASLDGLSIDKKRAVEIKNCNKDDHEFARSGIVPEHYYPQIQHQLECLGHDSMDYFSYNDGEGIIVNVPRDDKYIDKMVEVEKKFWDHVQTLTAPELTQDDYVTQGAEWSSYAEGLYLINKKISELKAQAELYKNFLLNICNTNNATDNVYKFTGYVRKGNVDYSQIPELKDVDLEPYRKNPTSYWKITKCKDGE